MGTPRYVVQIEPMSRTVTVGRKDSLEKSGLDGITLQLATTDPVGADFLSMPRSVPSIGRSPATVEPLPGERARVIFESRQSAITPGQVVTVYQDDLVLGGGWIDRALGDAELVAS